MKAWIFAEEVANGIAHAAVLREQVARSPGCRAAYGPLTQAEFAFETAIARAIERKPFEAMASLAIGRQRLAAAEQYVLDSVVEVAFAKFRRERA